MIITLWERWDTKSKVWKYNHYSEGYDVTQEEPEPRGALQEGSWPSGTWRKKKGKLENMKVIEDE